MVDRGQVQLVLSGGSAFGLDACGGVMDALAAQGRGYAVGPVTVPIVPGAIIFDLINGGDKNWQENPYRALGAAALGNAAGDFAIGRAGAGFGAMTADHMGGLGSASTVLPDGSTVGAIVAVNPMGSATTPDSRHFWAAPFEIGDEFGGKGVDPRSHMPAPMPSAKAVAMGLAPDPRANTTIAIVATDAPLNKAQCQRMAVMAHDGMARALVPSHTPFDGDLVFALSTTGGQGVDPGTLALIGSVAAQTLSRAIARGVHAAVPYPGDLLPCWQDAAG